MNLKHPNLYYHAIIILFLGIFFLFSNIAKAALIVRYEFNGDANDSSGHGYDGTLTGSVVIDHNSENDSNVLVCNGTSGYVSVPQEAFATINNEITIQVFL